MHCFNQSSVTALIVLSLHYVKVDCFIFIIGKSDILKLDIIIASEHV